MSQKDKHRHPWNDAVPHIRPSASSWKWDFRQAPPSKGHLEVCAIYSYTRVYLTSLGRDPSSLSNFLHIQERLSDGHRP